MRGTYTAPVNSFICFYQFSFVYFDYGNIKN